MLGKQFDLPFRGKKTSKLHAFHRLIKLPVNRIHVNNATMKFITLKVITKGRVSDLFCISDRPCLGFVSFHVVLKELILILSLSRIQ